jgi:hypothetical protein
VRTQVPPSTLEWLTAEENPAVAVLARRTLLGETDGATEQLWARRNEYEPVRVILEKMLPGGDWAPPARDYQKYWGSLWQVHFLGELYADPDDERVQAAARYTFSRQLPDGSWSASNARAAGSIPCLTANVGRALARLGFGQDERVIAALGHCAALYRELGCPNCRQGVGGQLNGYCHMLTPKELLFLAEVPRDAWPDGAEELRDACVEALRDKQVMNCLPVESKEFQEIYWTAGTHDREGLLEAFQAEHPSLTYGVKPGWLRFGYPLSYNSDALEALAALAAHGEPLREEYRPALEAVRQSASADLRWKLRNSFNGRMLVDVEKKGELSRWLTLRALQVLEHFAE